MTCREKLKQNKSGFVDERFIGGCYGCPSHHHIKAIGPKGCADGHANLDRCTACWDREVEE